MAGWRPRRQHALTCVVEGPSRTGLTSGSRMEILTRSALRTVAVAVAFAAVQ